MSDCIEWTGAKVFGYGVRRYKGKQWKAHRAAWDEKNGAIPDGMFVCHKCDNRSCVNIEHLFLGTAKQNSEDMVRKGRSSRHGKSRLCGEKNGRTKLTLEAVLEVSSTKGETKRLCAKYGVHRTTIQKIRRGDNWKATREAAEAARNEGTR